MLSARRGPRRLLTAVALGLGLLAAPLWPALGATTGTLTLNGNAPGTCPGGQCKGFKVVCSGAQAALNGFYSDRAPSGTAKGVVVFFTGSAGTTWWSEQSSGATSMINQLVSEGYRVVQVKWATPGWQVAQSGEQTGPANLACRPATVIKYVHDAIYVPLGLDPAAGKCGFCVTGHSNGSSQVGYAPSFYGLAGILDGLFPTAGPTYAALSKGCLGTAGYDYVALGQAGAIDKSYGFSSGGPCAGHTSSFSSRWTADGVATGGSSYSWPSTRVQFVVGASDGFRHHAEDMRNRLVAAGDQVLYQEIPGMGHSIYTNATGLAALHGAIVDAPIDIPTSGGGGGKGGDGGGGGGGGGK